MAQVERKGNTIIVTFDVSEATVKGAQPSSTGKMLIVDSTHGTQKVGEFSISGNLMVKNPAYQPEFGPKAKKVDTAKAA